MPKDDRGYTETQARPDTFSRDNSYGEDDRVEEAKQLSASESSRSIAKGSYYGRTES